MTVEQVSKYGAIAVLVAWNALTNMRLTKVEDQLYKCMEGKSITESKRTESFESQKLAILPKEIKIINKKK